jgi:hypothetical protein
MIYRSESHVFVTNSRYSVCKKCVQKTPLLPQAFAPKAHAPLAQARGLENQKYYRVLTPFAAFLIGLKPAPFY